MAGKHVWNLKFPLQSHSCTLTWFSPILRNVARHKLTPFVKANFWATRKIGCKRFKGLGNQALYHM
jgi:hypothetical protein